MYRKGYSIRCCYNSNGYLMQSQSSPLEGSYLLQDAVNSNYQVSGLAGKSTQLSYQLSHVKNYFACCSADLIQNKTSTKSCTSMTYQRATSQTCKGFRYSAWSAVVGDPHFITSDGTRYTFNGIGEYWFVYSPDETFATKIQVRFTPTVNACERLIIII